MKYLLFASLMMLSACSYDTPTSDSMSSSGDSSVEIADQDIIADTNSMPVARVGDAAQLVSVTSPQPGDTIDSPLELAGEAPGYRFFEGIAPVYVTDRNGLIIGEGWITATESWMTEDLIPFEGTIERSLSDNTPYPRGTIIFQRHNASGLPHNDAAVEIPVMLR